MKSARITLAAAHLGTALAMAAACVSAFSQQDEAAVAADVPDAPYARWLYGLDGARSVNDGTGLKSDLAGRLGTPADGMPYDHEISLQPDIRAISVTHNETVRFVTPNGQEFRWRFDTPRTVVSLSSIAPIDVPLASNVAVFVTGDPLERG